MYETALALSIASIKLSEGCKLKAYQDQGGRWTCGYGETQQVFPTTTYTLEEAENHLKQRVEGFLQGVLKDCPQLLVEPPSRIAACVDLAYNIGGHAFATSTVCRETAAKNYQAAADAFRLFKLVNGKPNQGVMNRRERTRLMYLQGAT